jgi:hypothetical protein
MSISENIRFAVRDVGEVSAILLRPQNAESLLVLAHGAGVGMTHPFMESLASELSLGHLIFDLGIGNINSSVPLQ